MKKLLLSVLIGTIVCICLIGCSRHSGSDHPEGEQSHSEHPTDHPE